VTRILFDTNILLDVLLDRRQFIDLSLQLWNLIEARKCEGLMAAHAVTTVHYLVVRSHSEQIAAQAIPRMLRIFDVATVDSVVIHAAMRSAYRTAPEVTGTAEDFEDAVTAAAAETAHCDLIVTRDPKGFRRSPVLAVAPEEALRLIG